MPARPDLKQALGRDAVYGDSPAAKNGAGGEARRRPGRPKKVDGPTWEESHERVTFHLPMELHRQVREEATRSGRTKSTVVADALREHLAKARRKG
ncbi:MAG TPA: TraY domain-containing protein [Acidimicrobiales bacterium]|nr:TraY domain-containing protein [Acidimicrobiales bacterium]